MQRSAWNLSRVVWRVSLPIIFVEATETFDHVIDTLFLARVGVTELGSIAVADSVMLLFLLLPLALVDGVQILTARRLGQRQPEAVAAVFNQGLLLILLVCGACVAALKLFSPVVANWIVESDAVGDAVHGYLQIDAYSIPLVGLTFACSALLTSLGKTGALIPATIAVRTWSSLLYAPEVGRLFAESSTNLTEILTVWTGQGAPVAVSIATK